MLVLAATVMELLLEDKARILVIPIRTVALFAGVSLVPFLGFIVDAGHI
jgi:hypothetical protein